MAYIKKKAPVNSAKKSAKKVPAKPIKKSSKKILPTKGYGKEIKSDNDGVFNDWKIAGVSYTNIPNIGEVKPATYKLSQETIEKITSALGDEKMKSLIMDYAKAGLEEDKKKSGQQEKTIRLQIKNVSDYTQRDVELFNISHDKQRDIHYSCGSHKVSYDEFLRMKNSFPVGSWSIKSVHIDSKNKPGAFVTHHFKRVEIDGASISRPLTPVLDPCQNMPYASLLKIEGKEGFHSGTQIHIDSIEPDTTIVYHITITGN